MVDESASGLATLREAFQPNSTRGRLAILTAAAVLSTPALAHFLSAWFLLLLPIALALSLLGLGRQGSRPQGRLARAGLAMAVNGGLLMAGLFFTGIIGDFFVESRSGLVSTSVGLGFTTVHIMLGIGLLVVDDYRHAHSPDI